MKKNCLKTLGYVALMANTFIARLTIKLKYKKE